MSKKKIYTAAVIGCGYIGAGVQYFDKKIQPATHAGAYYSNPRFKLVALVDNDQAKLEAAKRYFPSARLYSDIVTMLRAEKPDVVSVASPTQYHYRHVITLAKQHVPVILCEKPIADTVRHGEQMVRACRKSRSQLFVNYQRHFDPLIQKWAHKVKGGFLGPLYQANVYYYNGLHNNAGHMIDLLNLFFGMPKDVQVKFNKTTETEGKGFNADGLMWYDNNLLVTLQSLSKNYGYFSLSILGEKGSVSISKNTSPVIEFREKIPNREAKLYFELSNIIKREGKPRSMLVPTLAHIASYLDGNASPISQGEDGLLVLKVLDVLGRSARAQGKRITFKK